MAIGRLIIPSNDPDTPQRVIELRTSFFNRERIVYPIPPATGDPVVVPPGTTTGPTPDDADDNADNQGGGGIPPLFGNSEQTATCGDGRTGTPVTIAADTYTAVTLADANALAFAAAESALACDYLNTEQTAVCGPGRTGTPVTVAAGLFSASTQAAANALALADAQGELVCNYLNSAQTAVCPSDKTGTPVTVAAGVYSDTTQAGADALALAAATAGLSCMFLNETQTYVANCPNGFTGTPITVTKSPSATHAAATLAQANANALAAATAEAQAQLVCVPVVIPHPPVITSSLTSNATQGTAYNYQITGTNSPNTFGATNLPSGLTINPATGVISGTPTVSGVKNISISASNNDGKDTKTLVLTIAAQVLPPVITSSLTKAGTQHVALSYQIVATNNPTSYNATNLPAGLTINTGTGVISGTPLGSGNTNVSISATNGDGTDNKTLVIQVAANPLVPVITSSGTATGQQAVAFTYQIVATLNPTSYGATGLPAGLSVNTGTGLISGTPTVNGSFSITLSATNADGPGTKSLALTIKPLAPVITSALTASGQQNQGFSYQIVATNNPTSYFASGLPAGVTLNVTTGLISGIPTGNGTSNALIRAINSGGNGTQTLVVAIAVAPLPDLGERFAATHVRLELGRYSFGLRSVAELQVEAQELKTAQLVPIIYADDFAQSGIATLYDRWLTAIESIGWKMIPGFRGFQELAWQQWIIDRKNRAGFYRNSQGQVVISGFFTAWDLDQGNDWRANPSLGYLQRLRDAGMNPAFYTDPPPSNTQSSAFRAQAIGAKGTAIFFPSASGPFGNGVNTIGEFMGAVAAEKAACDNYSIQFMQAVYACGFVNDPAAGSRMLDLYGWDGVFQQFQFARQNGVRCIQMMTWRNFADHTHLAQFREGETVVGTAQTPFVAGTLILDHSGIARYCRRHVQWFITGTEPAITEDEVLVMTRLHPRTAKSYVNMTAAEKNAVSAWFPPESTTLPNGQTSAQELADDFVRLSSHDVMDDAVGVCTWLTASALVRVTVGSSVKEQTCPAGETRIIVPGNGIDSSAGGSKHRFTPDQFGLIKVEMFRNNVKVFEAQTPLAPQDSIIPGAYGLWSAKIVPSGHRLCGSHVMAAHLDSLAAYESCDETVARSIAAQWPLLWVHYDNPPARSGNYAQALQRICDAANGTAAKIIPGFFGNGTWSATEIGDFLRDYGDQPATFRPRGKPVFCCYDYRNFTSGPLATGIAAYGHPIELWVYLEPGAAGVPEILDDAYTGLEGWLGNHPEVGGVMNFAVNWQEANGVYVPQSSPRAADLTIARNQTIAAACRNKGRISIGGWAIRYHDDYLPDADLLRVWDALLADPTDYMFATTWNDGPNEQGSGESAVGDVGTDFDAGDIVWFPQRTAGWGNPRPFPRQTRYRQLVAPKVASYLALP